MRILVTGGSGRLGSAVIKKFLNDGWYVVSLVRRPLGTVHGLKEVEVDFSDEMALEAVIHYERPAAVVHMASVVGAACEDNPELAQEVNVRLTEQLARISGQCKVARFIFISTAAVYRQTSLEPTDEYTNIDPSSMYGKTKLAAEHAIQTVAREAPFTAFSTLRVFNIYGPGFDQSLVNKLIKSCPDAPVNLGGYDNFYRDYIHSDDVVQAICRCIDSKDIPSYAVYNIASGVALSNRQLVESIEDQGKSVYYTVTDDQVSYSWADISKARTEINFTPSSQIVTELPA